MTQAVRYSKLLALTGKDKPDHSYQAAIYLLSTDAVLCEKALPYVSTDGIDFPAMREKVPLDETEQQVVSIAHSLFTWKPVCNLSPYDLSQLGYPYIDYVSNALYIWMLTGAAQTNAAGQSFLWMSRDCGTWCFPERDVYIRNSDAHYTWSYYSYLDDVRAFLVEVNGVTNGSIKGNIVELDYSKNVEDVSRNSHLANSIEIEFADPHNVRTFELVEYNERRQSIQTRYGKPVKETYKVPDENALSHMLKTTRESHFKKATPTNVEDYIRDMERDYFHSRGYKTGDMAFIIPSDVFNAVKLGIAVYALYPQNVAEQIATTKEFDNLLMKNTLFGIRREDKPLLDYLIQRPSLKSELFTRDEYKELFSIALQAGKSNGLYATDKKTLDSIINKLDKIMFAVDNGAYETQQNFEKEAEGEYEPEE